MVTHSVQYAKTSDGVAIPYSATGSGIPLVRTPSCTFSHLTMEWDNTGFRSLYEGLNRQRKLVCYDPRGYGLSQRGITDFSSETHLLDLSAVLAEIPERPVVLFGQTVGCVTAVDYAEQHPDEIAALVLWNPEIDTGDGYGSWLPLLENDWDVYSRVYANTMTEGAPGEVSLAYAEMVRECASRETVLAQLKANARMMTARSREEIYGRVRHPALVIYRRDGVYSKFAHLAAAEIPHVKEVVLEGTTVPPWVGDTEEVTEAIDAFLSDVFACNAPRSQADLDRSLTDRETAVLRCLAEGMSNAEIGRQLVISVQTVKRHVSNILTKTRLSNRTQAARYAFKHGLLR